MSETKLPWWHGMQCAYCPNVADSEDHIPPRAMYAKGTKDLVTVPSCGDCRRKYSKDDEFFKTLMVTVASRMNHVAADHFAGSVARALKRFVGLGPKIKRQTVNFDILTDSGILTGEQMPAISIGDDDWERIRKVLIRFAIGLNYRLSKWKMRYDNHLFNVVDFESEDGQKALANTEITKTLDANKTIIMGDASVCRMKFAPYMTTKNAHLWVFEFYNRKRFFVRAIPREVAERIGREKGMKFISPSGIIY